jgi:O-antigen ligase
VATYADNSKPFARASLIMIGLAWTLPFLQPYHRLPLAGFYSEWLALALGLTASLLLLRRESWLFPALPAVALAPIGLAAVVGLHAALGRVPYPQQALLVVLYLMWASLITILGAVLRRELGMKALAAALAWWLVAGGILGALAGLMQHFHAAGVFGSVVMAKVMPASYGNLGQANHFAAYSTIALISALYLYGQGRLSVAGMAGCAVILLPSLAATGSRSIWLYLGLLALLALLLWRHDRSDARRFAVAALCVLPGFLAANWLMQLSLGPPPASPLPAVTSAERVFDLASGINIRLQLWREAWDLFLGAPLLGAGTGQFAWHHFLYQASGGAPADPRVFNHAHNLPLHLMAETGAAGALIVAGALLAWLAKLRGARLDLEWCWLLALLGVLGILSLLEHPLWYAYFLGVAALLLGMGSGAFFSLRFSGSARAVIAAGAAVGFLNLIAVLPPYRELERLVFAPEHAAQPRDDAEFARAIARVHREPLLVPYVEFAIAIGIEADKDRLPEKLALVGRAVHFAPAPYVAYRYALLLALAAEGEAARVQFERSMRVYPGELPQIKVQLADLARRYPAEMAPLLDVASGLTAARGTSIQ